MLLQQADKTRYFGQKLRFELEATVCFDTFHSNLQSLASAGSGWPQVTFPRIAHFPVSEAGNATTEGRESFSSF